MSKMDEAVLFASVLVVALALHRGRMEAPLMTKPDVTFHLIMVSLGLVHFVIVVAATAWVIAHA